jgi:hypothetical protein
MDQDIAWRMELTALRAELKRAQRRASVAISFSAVACISAGVYWLSNKTEPSSSGASPAAAIQKGGSPGQSLSVDVLTVKKIQLTDNKGVVDGTWDGSGLSFNQPLESISFTKPGDSISLSESDSESDTDASYSTMLTDNGLTFGASDTSAKSSYLYDNSANFTSNGVDIKSSSKEDPGETKIYPGEVDLVTQQAMNVDLGQVFLSPGPPSAGLYIYSQRFDKDHAGDAPVDGESASFTPQNIDLSDSLGINRVSIGQQPLKTPTTGATSVTGLSSITLFDTSGHLIWETPQ